LKAGRAWTSGSAGHCGGRTGGGPGRPVHGRASRRMRKKNSGSPLFSGCHSPTWLTEEDVREAPPVAIGASARLMSTVPGGGERRNGAGTE
jgi:hypothetical protein